VWRFRFTTWTADLWTLRRVADLIEKRLGVHYGLTGARRLLLQRLEFLVDSVAALAATEFFRHRASDYQ
jgi:hypothetical protein